MQDFSLQVIHDLTMDEIAGLITEEEKAFLYQVIADNEAAFKVWQHLHQTIGPQQLVEASMMHLNDPIELLHKHQALQQQRKKRNRNTAGIIASLVLLLTVSFCLTYMLLHTPKVMPETYTAHPVKDTNVLLLLPDGQEVNLSTDTANILVDNIIFTNRDSTLHYTGSKGMRGNSRLGVPRCNKFKVKLPDGTEVELYAESRLTFPLYFTGATREVYIDGEAYFKVAHNNHPFIVNLPNGGKVHVFGTEFKVSAYDSNAVKVSLVKGDLSFEKKSDGVRLRPGYEVVSMPGRPLQVESFNPEEIVNFREGIYHFNAEPLTTVGEVLTRWYNVTIKIKDDSLRLIRFTGKFDRRQKLEVFLQLIKNENPTLHYQLRNDTLFFQ